MATAKEIKAKMGSVKSTQKITRAMELIAASKMRNVRHRMEMARPYAQAARQIIRHIAESHPEYRHPYLAPKAPQAPRSVGIIVISSDRGLCGGLNINLFREVARQLRHWREAGVSVKAVVLGQKAQNFIRQCNVELLGAKAHLGDKPGVAEVIGGVKVMIDAFDSKDIDELHLFSNAFVSTVKQSPCQYRLLPIERMTVDESERKQAKYWDYLYEPEAKPVMNQLFRRYIESQVYQAMVENVACEQAARMIAMKNATDNAGKMLLQLKLKYNKARQAAITRELAEIVSGADAQKN